ncbi:hypothetical protein KR018_011462 [Drosophila ironensis]|nr:hypothetical protein KR018_011462 [Drosophila ironensis]
MADQWQCLLVLTLVCTIVLGFGCYFTAIHKKKTTLVSCYHMGGKCRDYFNCPENQQSRMLTICINRRKVCCLPEVQQKSLNELED